MPRFFIGSDAVSDGVITVRGDDARHIALSLRSKVGEELIFCTPDGCELTGVLRAVSPDTVAADVTSVSPGGAPEPPYRAVLYQALPKGDKLETIVMKAVETGVAEVVPVLCERSVSRPDGAAAAKKVERLRRIAREAAGQSGRGAVPAVGETITFEKAVEDASARCGALRFICCVGDDTEPLAGLLRQQGDPPGDICFFIGPEGGFSAREREYALSRGITPVSLGRRVLRCETASSFVLAWLALTFDAGCGINFDFHTE